MFKSILSRPTPGPRLRYLLLMVVPAVLLALMMMSPLFAASSRLTATDGDSFDAFGWDVAISGRIATIGARFDEAAGSNAGSAYIFQRSGTAWAQQTKLVASDAGPGDEFGTVVATDGHSVAVSAWLDDDRGADAGAVYIFGGPGRSWTDEVKLVASDGQADDRFGSSIAIDRSTLVVGAKFADAQGDNSGAAYVFERDSRGWTQVAKLVPPTGSSQEFGRSVTLDGSNILVGAIYVPGVVGSNGAVYAYHRAAGTWKQEALLLASDGASGDLFGSSLDLHGGVAVIGSPLDDDGGDNSGSAYLFRRQAGVWTQTAKLDAPDAAAGDQFGFSVATDGNTVLVGANAADRAQENVGVAYEFARSGQNWVSVASLTGTNADDWLGQTVAVAGRWHLLGLYRDGQIGTQAGAALMLDGSIAPVP